MDLVVTKVIAIAFWEFWTDEDGKKQSAGPRNEADEAKCMDQWKVSCLSFTDFASRWLVIDVYSE